MRNDEMKYYRDPSGDSDTIWAFLADGSQDSYISDNYLLMTEEDVDEYYKPKPYTDGEQLAWSSAPILGWVIATQEQIDALEKAQILAHAQGETTRLRMIADSAIAPLQDAIDLDMATDAEVALLKEWKRYRIALNRLPDQPGYPATIDWPVPPA